MLLYKANVYICAWKLLATLTSLTAAYGSVYKATKDTAGMH